MKCNLILVLSGLVLIGCNGGEQGLDIAPDPAAGEEVEAGPSMDLDISHGLVDPDIGPELAFPLDIDPASVLPGSSCLMVEPETVSFVAFVVGTIYTVPVTLIACGDTPLRIDGIYLAEGSSPAFSIDLTEFSHPPTPEHPVVLHPGEKAAVRVSFVMMTLSPLKDDGSYVPEEAELVVDASATPQHTVVPLSGATVDTNCPTAVIKCKEGDVVSPQTVVHLVGDESYGSNGTIVKWQWEVEQPVGSESIFVPSYTFPNPTFSVNIPGVYRFSLTVYNQNGLPSCYPAIYEVLVSVHP